MTASIHDHWTGSFQVSGDLTSPAIPDLFIKCDQLERWLFQLPASDWRFSKNE